ncbi:nodulation protein NodN [Pseudooceanicola nanhaiensis]|jgi:acyl dehydratase|uniref:Nodulation protein NodN n=1 Tax=Pseudooceanicola nanhaiensis TaxID=375761 RepID=A0A917T505_9RHOB|nr:MaoC family dehydratase [Pseudooceanicola nanhaiensis]GGM09696.1 nodulation protein NodN [Pseudooceanicola nanhaiensis]
MNREELKGKVGEVVGTSKWFVIDQARIDRFADVTEDWQYIHVDPEKAKASPFGTTIAHGFLTLSMLSAMVYDGGPEVDGVVMGVNYGFDKVRFVSPVKEGARVRAVFTMMDVTDKGPNEIQTTMGVSVEIEGQEKPALVAEWLGRRYFAEAAA